MSSVHTESMNRLMEQFRKLPGIGPRTAERLAYFILKQPAAEALALAEAIHKVKTQIRNCRRCHNFCEQDLCDICRDQRRDHSIICVVEQPKDLINLEATGMCNWVYHVLLGHLAPLEGVTPDDLTIDDLVKRVESGQIKEVVMATNPNLEGDGTALYITSLLSDMEVKITRLARGLPTGSSIEFANKNILSDAISGRVPM
ncbi:MAG: Recombination protein RecR [Planctomycetes bacterium ADurb.Bin412]|nr:MAG: Recombination protein RecR [Planctomycetes bacterium ADurb.Bin412]